MSETHAKPDPKKRGVVTYFVRERRKKTLKDGFSASGLVSALTVGLPVRELLDLQASLAVPGEKLAKLLGISKATMHRQKRAGGRLNPQVSDRVVRLARLLGLATEVLGDIDDAKQWLNSPQFGLGGAIPLDYAKTEVGAREVENLLGRIEYGVYS